MKSEFFVFNSKKKQGVNLYPDEILKVVPVIKRDSVELTNFYAFILCSIIEMYVIKEKYFFLHGCSFIKRGKAFVCIGPSGKGKTTIISKVKKEDRLSNDIVVIEQNNGNFYCHSSPFDNIYLTQRTNNRKFPLEAILVLSHGKTNLFSQLLPSEKLGSLIFNNPFYMAINSIPNNKLKQEKQRKTYKIFLQLINAVKIEKLTFTKEISFLSSL